MKASRELDALVAEKVMGMRAHPKWANEGLLYNGEEAESYSTDIAAAWPLVERFELYVGPHGKGVFLAQDDLEMPSIRAQGESGPHAICLAALKAVGALG